jgi:hypothetical protein
MPMDAGTLLNAIRPVCPVLSTKVIDGAIRSTWSYVPDPSATAPQISAADNVVATIPIDALKPIDTSTFIRRFTDAEYLAVYKKRLNDAAANQLGLTKSWDIVTFNGFIDLNLKITQDLKAGLVSAGILTQARADAIFGTTTLVLIV